MISLTALSLLVYGLCYVTATLYTQFVTLGQGTLAIYLGLFFLVSAISGYLVISATAKRPAVLVQAVMGSTVIKFFLYMGILSGFILANKESSQEIGAFFFVFYIMFTIFEKTFLMRSLSPSSDAGE